MSETLITLVVLVALLPITHDGQTYAPGERLSVTEAQAAPLIDSGAAELVEAGDAADPDAASGGSADAPAGRRAASAKTKR